MSEKKLPAIYLNAAPGAVIHSAEFTSEGARQFTMLTLEKGNDASQVKTWMQSAPLSQRLISETSTGGQTLLVFQGAQSPQQILGGLAQHGQQLAAPPEKPKPFNPWAWRGYTSILGQSLQIASSMKSQGNIGDRVAVFGFASLNLTANIINVLFGAQEKNDPHQQRYLQRQISADLAQYTGGAAPDPENVKPTHLAEKPKTSGEQLHDLLTKYSVTFGEIGLRTIGSMSLVFPVTQLGKAFKTFRQEGLSEAFKVAKNPNKATLMYGILMLTGKFTSFTAKEPDPYNPKPQSALDVFREKYAFKLSSVIEGSGAVWSANDRFRNQKIKNKAGNLVPDAYGGWGNVIFVGGYGVRLFAPYGTRNVNMPTLYAYVSDSLAKVPQDKLPTLLAETASKLQQHFNDPKLTAATIYGEIANDLQRHHHISVAPHISTEPPKASRVQQVTHMDRVAPSMEPGTALAQ